MEKKIIRTDKAPAPIGPYNQAVQYGNMLFVSGQIALDPNDGSLFVGDIAIETEKVMENIKAILNEAGMGFSNIIKSSIFLTILLFQQAFLTLCGRFDLTSSCTSYSWHILYCLT